MMKKFIITSAMVLALLSSTATVYASNGNANGNNRINSLCSGICMHYNGGGAQNRRGQNDGNVCVQNNPDCINNGECINQGNCENGGVPKLDGTGLKKRNGQCGK